ncbi:Uncharacterised protein [Pseudomonas putida]|nr:Uncharacterised protein [Pseudomonas putida]CAB5724026.1 Uncharacterised protein [Pseudomonas putida]
MGHCRRGDGAIADGAPLLEVRPDDHDFTGTEVLAVGDGFFLGLAARAGDVDESAQLLADRDQGGGYRQGVEAWHSQNAWGDLEPGLGRQQRLHAGVFAGFGGGADQIAGGFLGGRTGCHSHHDSHGLGLVGDRLQAGGQGAGGTGFADGSLYVGQQDRGIERENRGVCVVCSADHADDGSGNGSDWAGALVDFEDPDAVMVFVGHGVCLCRWMTLHRLPRARGIRERKGL